ncbi:MAG TPA: FtsL-like putative cell division protein [Membranihabitans sp.]|nr:FtsL-like putative cell division protein [Membranihabitans sp.]
MKVKMKQKLGSKQVSDWLSHNSRYVLFLFFLAFLAIMNSHVAEKKIRTITHMKNEVKELNWKYLTLKAEWMNDASLSSLEDRLDVNSIGKEGSKPLILKVRDDR